MLLLFVVGPAEWSEDVLRVLCVMWEAPVGYAARKVALVENDRRGSGG